MAQPEIGETFTLPAEAPSAPPGRWAAPSTGEEPGVGESFTLPPEPSVGEDVAKSAATQGVKGIVADIPGVFGAGGQLYDAAARAMMRYGVAPIAERAGIASPGLADRVEAAREAKMSPDEKAGDINSIFGLRFPTPQGIEKTLNTVAPALDYAPKTTAGKFAGNAARMATSSMALGPGETLLGKAALGALAGTTSEAAGQLVENSGFEGLSPYARFLGAALGPAATLKAANAVRNAALPSESAQQQVLAALGRDLNRGKGAMTPQQIQEAYANGASPTLLDMGGPDLRGVLKRYGYAGPQAEAEFNNLNTALQQRAAESGARLSDHISQQFGVTTDAASKQTAVNAANKPFVDQMYNVARNDPAAAAVDTPGLTALSGSDTIKAAMKKAKSVSTDPGSLIVAPSKTAPSKTAPSETAPSETAPGNLPFWDQVKQNLDDQISVADRAGERAEMRRLTGLKQQLVGELDAAVPAYRTARDTASEAFGQANALDAGYHVAKNGDAFATRDVLNGFGKFNPGQQDLFRQGAADYLREVAAGGGPKALVKVLSKPQTQTRLSTVLGQSEYDALYGRAISEQLTSAAKPVEASGHRFGLETATAGALGAATGSALEGFSSLLGGHLSGTVLGVGAATGAAKALFNIQERRVAPEVMRLAQSSDPAQLARLAKLARSNAAARSFADKASDAMTAAAVAAYKANAPSPAQTQPDRPQRAAGGRTGIDHASVAAHLVRSVEHVRRAQSKTTEPLLKVPDEAIARSLAVANQGI